MIKNIRVKTKSQLVPIELENIEQVIISEVISLSNDQSLASNDVMQLIVDIPEEFTSVQYIVEELLFMTPIKLWCRKMGYKRKIVNLPTARITHYIRKAGDPNFES